MAITMAEAGTNSCIAAGLQNKFHWLKPKLKNCMVLIVGAPSLMKQGRKFKGNC
jgi:hypothetical protein